MDIIAMVIMDTITKDIVMVVDIVVIMDIAQNITNLDIIIKDIKDMINRLKDKDSRQYLVTMGLKIVIILANYINCNFKVLWIIN